MSLVSLAKSISRKGYLWTQGAGGNVSEKRGDELWVKASGFRLDQMSETLGFSVVDLKRIRSGLDQLVHTPDEKKYSELLKASVLRGEPRPSMETGLHAELPKRYVAHFHSVIAVIMAQIQKEQPARFQAWYQMQGLQLWGPLKCLPLVMPGLQLSNQIRSHKGIDLILLENHGVVIQSEEVIDFQAFESFEVAFCREFLQPVILESYMRLREFAPTGPIRFLFPDFAIVFDQLFPELSQNGNQFTPKPDLSLSLQEIWLAHLFLDRFAPGLSELPPGFVEELVDLPTEQFRRGVKL